MNPDAASSDTQVCPGTIYVVATPIGNAGDMTARAREVLSRVVRVAAEDTRHTRQLLQLLGIEADLTSLHEHNEAGKAAVLLDRVTSGESLAVVSDAGTPLISDPGFHLIEAARQRGIAVVAVPGACAAIAALSIAGLPTDRFTFEGFLPAKSAARRSHLEALAAERRTMVFYEAPHRLRETIDDMCAMFGVERRASVSRELTKRFETTYSGSLGELAASAAQDENMSRGEIVIVVAGAEKQREAATFDAQQLLRALLEELAPSQAAKIAARITGSKRAELYELALRIAGK